MIDGYEILKRKHDKKKICSAQLQILEKILESEQESKRLKSDIKLKGKEIKKIVEKGVNKNSKEILIKKSNEIKSLKKQLEMFKKRRQLLRRLMDSIAWQIFGRIVVMNTQRENIDFLSDKIGLENEKDFFNKKAKEESTMLY